MGHDEDKKYFNARVGMRPSRDVSAAQAELDRISADSNPNKVEPTGTGDIKLNNSAPSSKSPKIFVLVVLAVVAVIAIVVCLIVTKGKIIPGVGDDGKKSNKTAYLKILQYGDAEAEKDFDKNLIVFDSYLYRMTFDEVSVAERSNYSNKLLEAYKKYKSDDSDSVRKFLEAYNSYMTLENELNEIERIYLEKGEKSAKERFASEKIEKDGSEPLTNAEYLIREVFEYKSAFVSELVEYNAMGCIANGTKNEGCIEVMRSNVRQYPNFMKIEQIMFAIDNEIGEYAENATKQLYNMSIAGE